MDCPPRTPPPLYGSDLLSVDPPARGPVGAADADRHPAVDQHSSRRRGVDLQRAPGRGHGAASHARRRARLLDDGRQHRAHGFGVDLGHRHHPHVHGPRVRHRRGHRSGHLAVDAEHALHAHGDAAAEHPAVQRLQRPCRPDHDVQRPDHGDGDLRLHAELHAAAALHDTGFAVAAALRRDGPAGLGGSRSGQARCQAARAAGRGAGRAGVERHPPGRRGARGRPRVRRAAQQQPRELCGVQPHPRQGRQRRDRLSG